MTDHQFDDLAKTLATGASRRTFLKGLGGTALATAFSVFGAGQVDARKGKGKGKDKDKQKCRGEGHPCVGNGNVCCDGLICAETGPGQVSRCTTPPAELPPPPSNTIICGPNVCGPGEFCCNESCGICAPIDGSCTQQFCG